MLLPEFRPIAGRYITEAFKTPKLVKYFGRAPRADQLDQGV